MSSEEMDKRVENMTVKTGPYDQEVLREAIWEAINKYSANRADLNARSSAAARINEIINMMLRTEK